jgi:hypothetical protein
VLLSQASKLAEVDVTMKSILTAERIQAIVSLIPSEWLNEESFTNSEEQRQAYASFLLSRIGSSEIFINEAQNARKTLI